MKENNIYRPFANDEECWRKMEQHHPFGWVMVDSERQEKYQIISLNNGIHIAGENTYLWYTFDQAYKYMLFIDGEPFGIKQ